MSRIAADSQAKRKTMRSLHLQKDIHNLTCTTAVEEEEGGISFNGKLLLSTPDSFNIWQALHFSKPSELLRWCVNLTEKSSYRIGANPIILFHTWPCPWTQKKLTASFKEVGPLIWSIMLPRTFSLSSLSLIPTTLTGLSQSLPSLAPAPQ